MSKRAPDHRLNVERRRVRLVTLAALVVAAAAHVMAVVYLRSVWPKRELARAQPVKIRIVDLSKERAAEAEALKVEEREQIAKRERPRTQPRKASKPSPPAKTEAPTNDEGASADPASSSSSERSPRMAYEGLLPGSAWLGRNGDGDGGGAGTGSGSNIGGLLGTAEHIMADDISGKIDIPLLHRKNIGNAHASARIVLVSPRQWKFASVDGDPILRASLYEALRVEPNKSRILELMTVTELADLLITLRVESSKANISIPSLERIAAATRGRIDVRYALVSPLSGGGGGGGSLSMMLPDHEADRAILRDRAHLQKLQESAAFVAPIRDRLP